MILPVMDFTTDAPYNEIKKTKPKYQNYVYLQIDNKVLKLGITIDDKILKKHIEYLISNLDEFMFDIVSEEEMKNCCFPIKMEYIGKFRLYEKRKTRNYKIPAVDINECSLIYVLNSIYNNNGLTNEDLYNLSAEKEMCKDNLCKRNIIEDIISNLSITVIEEYDATGLSYLVDYISNDINKEDSWNKTNLKKLKSIFLEAEKNIEVFKKLNIYDTNEFIYPIKKQKQLKK